VRIRLTTLIAAALMVLMAMPAFAQDPQDANVTPQNSLSCIVDVPASATTSGQVRCAVGGMLPLTNFTITVSFAQSVVNGSGSFEQSSAPAIAFVAAQSNGISVTMTGTADGNGNGNGNAVVPSGANTFAPATVAFSGTDTNGNPVSANTRMMQALARTADTNLTAAPDSPAIGTQSGVLELIAAAALILGASTLIASRRRREPVA
jgi:hypothetical protein